MQEKSLEKTILGLGSRLKEAMHKLGISNPTQLAKSIGINKSTAYAIISDKANPSSIILKKVLDLGISIDWLLTGRGEMLVHERAEKKQQKVTDEGATPYETNRTLADIYELMAIARHMDKETLEIVIKLLQKDVESG